MVLWFLKQCSIQVIRQQFNGFFSHLFIRFGLRCFFIGAAVLPVFVGFTYMLITVSLVFWSLEAVQLYVSNMV